MTMKNEIKNLSIEERIVKSELFWFDDGYLGSTGHGACYYEDLIDNVSEIKSENDLRNLVLDEEFCDEIYNEDENGVVITSWSDYFDMWFSDCNDYEIIDSINGGYGYGKIVVDKVNKNIKIMVVPCLYSNYNSNKENDVNIFGFDYNNGELVREISDEKLIEILKDKDYFIG